MRIAAAIAIFVFSASAASARSPLIIDAADVPAYIASTHPVIVSVQTQIDPKPSGFVSGAISLDQDDWTLDSRSEDQLDDLVQWSALFGVKGVDGRKPVLVYDNGDLKFASRVRYLLGHYGVEATLVNGGWSGLKMQKLPLQPGPSPSVYVKANTHIVEPPIPIASRATVRAHLHGPSYTLIDVRSPAEYDGTDIFPGIKRPGHIPGAVNLPLNLLFSSATTLMNPAALKAAFAAHHIDPKTTLIFYCQDGARSSLGALAAVQAGYPYVRLYYLSYLDWQSDPSDPVDK
jgi:thiosulfate/3-mercaptopyruvate sulfurtransferase